MPPTPESSTATQSPEPRLPVVAIVGRPNVGKSTLFNCLTGSRDSLVADQPGVTRDRQYGLGKLAERACIVVDTGGIDHAPDEITRLVAEQVETAMDQADLLLFVVDAKHGLTASDENICTDLRRRNQPVMLVINKVDGRGSDATSIEFHRLGLGAEVRISAAHRRGLKSLGEKASELLDADFAPAATATSEARKNSSASVAIKAEHGSLRAAIAIIGRPNVGKSTLVNRLSGSNWVLAHDMPGTTRDSIRVPFNLDSEDLWLIDTAGVRRRSKVDAGVEKLSVLKTLDALSKCEVAILMLDAQEGVTDQDAHLLGLILDANRALVIAMNKWDGLDRETRTHVRDSLLRKFPFVDFAEQIPISALRGSGFGELLGAVRTARKAARANLSTPMLTRILENALERHPPPMVRGRRIKLRYAHQGGQSPPRIVIHGNQTESVPDAYKRYLARAFREATGIRGTPIALEFRSTDNPYKGIRNKLTPRQERKRQRLIRHVKRKR